jgi:hypothetical protein
MLQKEKAGAFTSERKSEISISHNRITILHDGIQVR